MKKFFRAPYYWAFKWAEDLGLPDCPYATRWVLAFGIGTIRIHHFRGPDDLRNHHDHPWSFVTIVLRGGYTDISRGPDGEQHLDHLRRGSIRYRDKLHRHAVAPDTGGCWTLVISGPVSRAWGFWERRKDGSGTYRFVKSGRYFRRWGHPACDDG